MTARAGFCGRAARLALALLGLAVLPARADEAGDFSFYVLSLSWSPTYCAEHRDEALQCRAAKPFGFIVHGFWPQRERGYPERCATREAPPSRDLVRGLFDIMPSEGLVRHQWRKHGACSGLSASNYFALLRQARERVAIPAQFERPGGQRDVDARAVESAFARANPGLKNSQMAVSCEGALLDEVRICMERDLSFRACAEVDRRGCRRGSIEVPPAAGP